MVVLTRQSVAKKLQTIEKQIQEILGHKQTWVLLDFVEQGDLFWVMQTLKKLNARIYENNKENKGIQNRGRKTESRRRV